MKKIIAMLLAVMLVVSMAACGSKEEGGNNNAAGTETETPTSALEILENVWASYTDDEKFPVFGGNAGDNMVDGAPGAFDVADTDGMTYTLLVPAEQTTFVDGAASLVHGMLANNFTCGVFHITGDTQAFAEAMKTAVAGNRWMCGMPEKMLVATISGEYVVVAFGLNDAINPFQAKLAAAYPAMQQLCFEDLAQ